MSYVGLDPKHWDEVFGFPLTCRAVWVMLLSGRHSLEIPGLLVTSHDALAAEMGNTAEDVQAALEGLEARGRVQWNRQRRVIRVPKAMEFYPSPGPNIVRGWFRKWESVPDCDLKFTHVDSVQSRVSLTADSADTMVKAWRETFGKVEHKKIKPVGTLPLPFGNPSPNPSETKGSGSGSVSGSGKGKGSDSGEETPEGFRKGSERVLRVVPDEAIHAHSAPDAFETRCARLWAVQEELRAKLGLPAKNAPGKALEAFQAQIRARTDAEVEHVLQVCFAESEVNPADGKWFDGFSNWQEDAFERKLGRSLSSVRAQPSTRRRGTYFQVNGNEVYPAGREI